MSKQCPSCGGSGKDVGITQKGKDGWKETTHASCPTCGGMGFVNDSVNVSSGGGGGKSSRGCFPSNTMIKTPSGYQKIDSLNPGDPVYSYNHTKNIVIEGVVIKILKHEPNRIWEIVFDDGRKVRTTEIHSFLSDGNWIHAKKLVPNQNVTFARENGRFEVRKVVRISDTEKSEKVYNLIVSNGYSFYADGALVHSFSYFRRFRSIVWEASISLRNEFLVKNIIKG